MRRVNHIKYNGAIPDLLFRNVMWWDIIPPLLLSNFSYFTCIELEISSRSLRISCKVFVPRIFLSVVWDNNLNIIQVKCLSVKHKQSSGAREMWQASLTQRLLSFNLSPRSLRTEKPSLLLINSTQPGWMMSIFHISNTNGGIGDPVVHLKHS